MHKYSLLAAITISLCLHYGWSQVPIHTGKITGGNRDTNVVLPPAWAFGVLYGGCTDQEGTIRRIKEIRTHNYPIDGYWIDSWFWDHTGKGKGPEKYIDFVADTVNFPNRKLMWDFLQQNGIRSLHI
jgi:alpha-glucosidase (family GH31 glycosyl hydrolase)